MNIKVVSLTEISDGRFDVALKIDDAIENIQLSIFEKNGVFGIESTEFEFLLLKLYSGKERQKLIAEIRAKYISHKKMSELQAA